MKKYLNSVLALSLLVILPSCVHQIYKDSLSKISIGMTKDQIISRLGKPYVNRGAYIMNNSVPCEVWEYCVFQPWQGTRSYLFYFVEDCLVQYGQGQDWQNQTITVKNIN